MNAVQAFVWYHAAFWVCLDGFLFTIATLGAM